MAALKLLRGPSAPSSNQTGQGKLPFRCADFNIPTPSGSTVRAKQDQPDLRGGLKANAIDKLALAIRARQGNILNHCVLALDEACLAQQLCFVGGQCVGSIHDYLTVEDALKLSDKDVATQVRSNF